MWELGKPEAALDSYTSALKLKPDLAEAHFALALWHIHNGTDLGRALDHLDKNRVVRRLCWKQCC